MQRAWYSNSLAGFLEAKPGDVLDRLASRAAQAGLPALREQIEAWEQEIGFLQGALRETAGSIYFEYSIPRMGQRADVLLLMKSVVFVLEFKVGEDTFTRAAEDQVWDYALDLKNFHETSHPLHVAPVLIATAAKSAPADPPAPGPDKVFVPLKATPDSFRSLVDRVLEVTDGAGGDREIWETGRYRPTPTIVEAARSLYGRHSVLDIARNDAGAKNLTVTSQALSDIIIASRVHRRKTICFVTGVPGAGKTLVGLNIATQYMQPTDELYAVFLSGNGPLVRILGEALARDEVQRMKAAGTPVTKGEARSKVKAFIQNVHHFRDECLRDDTRPPIEHVALFDEAQRAWHRAKTSDFMRRKKKRAGFDMSEPEFLISCLDRHADWAVIVCLIGGGQEINTGEAGIGEWIASVKRSFPNWHVCISPRLTDSEYGSGEALTMLGTGEKVEYHDALHLATSMRSFRAENVSLLVKQILDLDASGARSTLGQTSAAYPIALTRDLGMARRWLKARSRGSERYGIVVSSQAERLKPHGIAVRAPMDPVHWFLDGKEDVRSSYYLEDVATEFHVQGLELDWACVTWDADLRYGSRGWKHWSFRGHRWNNIHKPDRKRYLTNAYRVLLTRARQGMIIVVPRGDPEDPTRDPGYYDPTYAYLKEIGIPEV